MSEKDFYYNLIEKQSEGGSHHYTFDSEGNLVSVFTPSNPDLNVSVKKVLSPSPELVRETQVRFVRARLAVQHFFAENAAD